MSFRFFTILLLSIIPLVSSKEYIDSRALKIFNNSILVENVECDSRKDYHDCDDFTLFHIYAFAAKIPPSGAGGYITDEPQFACSHVEPPKNSSIEWAALVYYSSMSCDCSYEEKILHVQAAGYTIALLMETNNCTDNFGDNDTDITDITIPAVLLSQTVGLSLLSYSSPTDDAQPTGSVIVEAHYGNDTIIAIIACFIFFVGIIFLFRTLLCCCLCCKNCCCCCCRQCNGRPAIQEPHTYETLPSTEPEDQSEPSNDTESNDTESNDTESNDTEIEELPELISSQADYVTIPSQKINSDKQHSIMYSSNK